MKRDELVLAAILAASFATLALSILALGYPHEDAYILFKYARNVAAGAGSVYYAGGPRAEGATDFLWMIALAGLRVVRIDPAIGAVALNAFGMGLLATRLRALAVHMGCSSRDSLALAAGASALCLLLPVGVAGALGFSATLYGAVALHLYLELVRRRFAHIPLLAVGLGLIRPDGVIIGAGATLMALAIATRETRRAMVAPLGAAVAIGATYFALRWRYFGSLLPLPLIVKSHYSGHPGLYELYDWLASTPAPLVGLALALVLWFGRAAFSNAAAIALVPFAVHVVSFVPSMPSQNVADRFQAPDGLALLAFAVTLAARGLAVGKHRVPAFALGVGLAVLFAAASIPQLIVGERGLAEAYQKDYVDPFSVRLAEISRERALRGAAPLRVAATEAGRVLYWIDGPAYDLVGLNTAEAAHEAPTRAGLARFDPDVIMIHPAGGLDENALERGRVHDATFGITPPLAQYVQPWNRELIAPTLPPYSALHMDHVRVAPMAAVGFMNEHDYDFYAARFTARFARFHVYGIKRELPEKQAIVDALVASHDPSRHGSHLSAIAR